MSRENQAQNKTLYQIQELLFWGSICLTALECIHQKLHNVEAYGLQSTQKERGNANGWEGGRQKGKPQLYIIQLELVLALLFRMWAICQRTRNQNPAPTYPALALFSCQFERERENERQSKLEREMKRLLLLSLGCQWN